MYCTLLRLFAVLLALACLPLQSAAENAQYDIAYLWDDTLENVLDYQTQLAEILGDDTARHLRIVGRKEGGFGIIYDHNGTALSSAQLMIQHSEFLRSAGLAECFAIEDNGYYELYNVSYGLGPNLEDLKDVYRKVYRYLGSEVGKNLFIEQTDANNYTLIYRRRDERSSTYKVARKHGKILKRRGISTTIIAEKNNPVVFGESSHLDDEEAAEPETVAEAAKQTAEQPGIPVVQPTELQAKQKQPETLAVQPTEAPKEQQQQQAAVVERPSAPEAVRNQDNTNFEHAIESYIDQLRQQGKLSSDEKTSWVVYDLTRDVSLVDINADQVFQAASMIKPFIALAFFHQVQEGSLLYGPKSRRNMELMIQRSDNVATNWVMRVAGGPDKCAELLRTHYGSIFKNTVITEYIPPGGKTYKNSALPSDYIRFLLALWNNELPYGKEIRRLMSLPGRDRLYDGTPIPQGTLVYNKTGSTAHLCGDMGILVPRDKNGKRYPYAVVGIIERSSRPQNYGDWMLTRGNVIRHVSTLVYQEMKRQYQLL